MKKKVIILDTSGFLAKIHLQIYDSEIYTTSSVIGEVRDLENREALDLGLEIDRVKVIEPKIETLSTVYMVVRKLGLENKLSRTDIEVASLAYDLNREYDVIVFTDDYSLQYLLSRFNIVFKSLKTRGISLNK